MPAFNSDPFWPTGEDLPTGRRDVYCHLCNRLHRASVTKLINPAIINGECYYYVSQCPDTWEPLYFRKLEDLVSKEIRGMC